MLKLEQHSNVLNTIAAGILLKHLKCNKVKVILEAATRTIN